MRKVCVLTNQLTANAAIEIWFIQNVLLQGMSLGLEWEAENLRDSVVVYLEIGYLDKALIQGLKDRNNRVILVQMGDEFLEKYDKEAYLLCDAAFRNYYFPEIFDDPDLQGKAFWIPNGYKSGVGPRQASTLRPAASRRFLSSFLGWIDNPRAFGNERSLFREVVGRCQNDLLMQPTESFAKGFNVGLYASVLEYSVFCACPAGNSPETIRLYDALEMGCIPISLRHTFLSRRDALGEPPFPLLNSWDELPEFLKESRARMATDPESVNQMQKACVAWWKLQEKNIANKISTVIFSHQR